MQTLGTNRAGRQAAMSFPKLEPIVMFDPAAPVTIYAIVHPTTREVVYVGKTITPVARFKAHLAAPTTLGAWAAELRRAGMTPEMVTIDRCGFGDWDEVERRWIARYRARGELLNVREGGGAMSALDRAAVRAGIISRFAYARALELANPPVKPRPVPRRRIRARNRVWARPAAPPPPVAPIARAVSPGEAHARRMADLYRKHPTWTQPDAMAVSLVQR